MEPKVEEINGAALVQEMRDSMEKMLQKKVNAITVSNTVNTDSGVLL